MPIYAEREKLLNESLTIARKRGDKRVEAAAVMNLADMALTRRDAVKLKNYTRQSLNLSREIGSIDGETLALRAMGMAFLLEANTDSAGWYANQALKINKENNLRRETLEVLNLLSGISYASGKMIDGFDFSRQFNDTLKMMVNEVISQQSAELEKKYEAEKKQNQINQLQSQALLQQFSIRQKSTLNYILAGSAAAILIIALLSYRTYRNRQKFQQQKIDTLETKKYLAGKHSSPMLLSQIK